MGQMKRFFFTKSIKTRLKFWFFGIGLLPLLVVSAVIYQQSVDSIKREAFIKLTAIRDLKTSQINLWLDERTGDIRALAEDNEITIHADYIIHKKEKPSDSIQIIHNILNRYIENYTAWDEIFLVETNTGKIIASSDQKSTGLDKSDNIYFRESLLRKGTYISNIYYSKSLHQPAMVFTHPVFNPENRNLVIGILVARVDLENSLYNLLLDRSGMGSTGETLIVNDKSIALNELRWHQKAPLRLIIRAKPAVLGSQGNVGITETADYRNEQVLAAYGYISRIQWGLVAKQDLVEIYAPIDDLIRNLLIILLISVVATYFVSTFVANAIAQPVLEMAEVSKKVQKGDLTARNQIDSNDEIGFLSESFNLMADSVMSQIFVQQQVVAFTETLVVTKNISDFSQKLVTAMVELTNAGLAVFYRKNDIRNQFEHMYSIGGSLSSLDPFDSLILEGEIGKAAALGKIVHIQNIPKDTVFKLRSIAGTAVPNAIITIPVKVYDQVKAIISLSSLIPFSKDHLEIIDLIHSSINTAFANIIAIEKTRLLALELESKNRELESQTVEMKSQSSALADQNTELERQQMQVEEANRLKSEFLSNMSHELRTPLNSIMALSRILVRRTKEKLSDEESGFLEIIERNGKQLLALINDILDLSKIEAGKVELKYQTFSITTIINTILSSVEHLAAEKHVEINQQVEEGLPSIESDQSRVHKILQNIIGNAIKFTEQGSVFISVHKSLENIIIQVKDTGVGISREALPHIFDEFRQADGSASRKYEGTGLGLAIAYKAVNLLGGNITVESVLGQGTTFSVHLPFKRGQTSPVISETPSIETTPTFQLDPASSQKPILVVDDNPVSVSIISNFLNEEGYNTIAAGSGQEALDLVEYYHFFAITLDALMPEMDGWEVLQRLKEDQKTADIPVIIISIADDKKTGFALGAIGYITKPITRLSLISEIKKLRPPMLRSILIVDDNEFERSEIVRIIESEENVKVTTAANGRECMEILKKFPPDIMVLDLMMPEMNGFEVLREMRRHPETMRIPVIISTAKDLTDFERNELQMSVASIVTKNGTPASLFSELRRLLQEIEHNSETEKSVKMKPGANILLVEDNESAIIQVTHILRAAGYHVDTARGGQEAIDFVQITIPDGIILDLMMPDINGFEVLDKIRGTEATAEIPVLILTAKDLTKRDLKQLNANNIQQLVQKGDVDPDNLVFKIQLMLGTKPRPKHTSEHLEKPETTIPTQVIMPKEKKRGRPSILIVEDNPDNMATIKAILGDSYHLMEAIDGETGLELTQTTLPDLVLLDISLPKMDGFQVVHRIKANDQTRDIPVIAITARAMIGEKEKILQAGCDDYISKPIDPDLLIEEVKKWLK